MTTHYRTCEGDYSLKDLWRWLLIKGPDSEDVQIILEPVSEGVYFFLGPVSEDVYSFQALSVKESILEFPVSEGVYSLKDLPVKVSISF